MEYVILFWIIFFYCEFKEIADSAKIAFISTIISGIGIKFIENLWEVLGYMLGGMLCGK